MKRDEVKPWLKIVEEGYLFSTRGSAGGAWRPAAKKRNITGGVVRRYNQCTSSEVTGCGDERKKKRVGARRKKNR